MDEYLRATIPYGIAYHNSGTRRSERETKEVEKREGRDVAVSGEKGLMIICRTNWGRKRDNRSGVSRPHDLYPRFNFHTQCR
jgi:hypothetical protein